MLMLLIQASPVIAETTPMPTKTPFDPLPTKTAFPLDPPTTPSGPRTPTSAVGNGQTLVPSEPPVKTLPPTDQPATPSASHIRVDRTATPTTSPSATPSPTQRRPRSTATPLPSATITITKSPTPDPIQTRPPQLSLSPIFNVISSPDSSAPVLGLLSLIGLIGLARLYQQHIWARADLYLRRAALQLTRRAQLIIDDEWIITRLNQAVFDATGQDIGLDTLERVLIYPPAIVGLGRDFQRVIFTPASTDTRALTPLLDGAPRRLLAHRIEARHNDPFVSDDLAAAYCYLCRQNYLAPSLLARLARCDRWLIYLLPPPDSHSQRR